MKPDGTPLVAPVNENGTFALEREFDNGAMPEVLDPQGFVLCAERGGALDIDGRTVITVARPVRLGVRFRSANGLLSPLARPPRGAIARQSLWPSIVALPFRLHSEAGSYYRVEENGAVISQGGRYVPLPSAGFDVELQLGCAGAIILESCLPQYLHLVLGSTIIESRLVATPADVVEFSVDLGVVSNAYGGVSGRVIGLDVPTMAAQLGGVVVLDDPAVARFAVEPVKSDGSFLIESLAPGECFFVAHFSGFRKTVVPVSVRSGVVSQLGDIVIDRGRTVYGTVTAEAGAPATPKLWAGTLLAQGRDRWIGTFPDHYLDPDTGSFAIMQLPPEHIVIGIDDTEYTCQPLVVDLSRGDALGVEVRVSRGVVVYFKTANWSNVTRLDVSDSAGILVHSMNGEAAKRSIRLVSGRYFLDVHCFNAEPQSVQFDVREGGETQVEF